MKKLILSAAFLALTAGAALAADLPARKAPPVLPPPPPPPPMWTGFYVGLNAGGGWSNSNSQYIAVGPAALAPGSYYSRPVWPATAAAFSTAASATGANTGKGGFIGGGQVGYNFQVSNFVVGLEADIQGIAASGGGRTSITAAPTGDFLNSNFVGITSARGNLQYLGTVRGRLGWLATPTLLLYGTGGLAYGGVSINTATTVSNDQLSSVPYAWPYVPATFGGVNYSNTQVGWTAGGGLEWMFWPNWSAKVEYLYYDLGTIRQNFAMAVTDNVDNENLFQTSIFAGQVRARVNGNIVRAGVNYHFNWGSAAPVVAKY